MSWDEERAICEARIDAARGQVPDATGNATIALAIATVALVEQQRVANRIALASLRANFDELPGVLVGSDPVKVFDFDGIGVGKMKPKADIARALGLES